MDLNFAVKRACCWTVTLLFGLSLPVLAERLAFRNYTPETGLASSRVLCIFQDSGGYLWAGCTGGLSRFDGVGFALFGMEQGIPQNSVYAMAEDAYRSLWVGTLQGPALYLPGEKRFQLMKETGSPVAAMALFHGTLFCLTADGRLGRLVAGGGWIFSSLPAGSGPFTAMVSNGNYLYVAAGNEVWQYAFPLSPELPVFRYRLAFPVNALGTRPENPGCQAATDGGLYSLDGLGGPVAGPASGTAGNRILALAKPYGSTTWVGGAEGLRMLPDGGDGWLGRASGLPGTPVTALHADREGILWIGTMNGLGRLDNTTIRTYTEQSGLAGISALAVQWDEAGKKLWASTSEGLYFLQGKQFVPFAAPGDPFRKYTVWTILPRGDGTVWVGTEGGGIGVISPGGAVRFLRRGDGLPGDRVTDLLQDRRGAVWVACQEGLARVADGRVTAWTRAEGLPCSYVRCLQEVPDGRGLLLGTVGAGLVRFDGQRFVRVPLPWNSEIRGVYDILAKDGLLWLAADEGLLSLDGQGRLRRCGLAQGLPSVICTALLDAGPGRIWVGTDGGAVLIDSRRGLALQTLTHRHGLPGNEFNVKDGVCHTPDGKTWFAVVGGVSSVDAQFFQDKQGSSARPLVGLKRAVAVMSDGRELVFPQFKDTRLDSNVKSLRFDFAVLLFRDSRHRSIQVKLEGYDSSFVDVGDRRYKEYTNLPAGNYSFLVRVQENGFPPVETRLSTFVVKPTLWENPLVYCVVLALVIIVVHFGFRLRYRLMERDKSRLEEAVRRATNELEKKNSLLKHLAVTDELTGLYNRRYFTKTLHQELLRMARAKEGTGMALLLLDLDHFKKVNDTHGHEVGDWVLQHLARCLRSSVRAIDTVARFGGEEFVILLPQTEPAGAKRVGEKIRLILSAFPAEKDDLKVMCTVSIGIACLVAPIRPQDCQVADLLRRADAMLYVAKAQGRNRVICEASVYDHSPTRPQADKKVPAQGREM